MSDNREPNSASQTTSLTVEIVNDSHNHDGAVFLLLTGNAVSATGITSLQLPQPTDGSVTASALETMPITGSVISPYTGKLRNIRSFQLNTLTSGRLLISYETAITYAKNQAPTATGLNIRWDKLEFGFPGSGADLTSIDFFGIPLQFEYLDAAGNVLSSRSFYTSTKTLLSALDNLSPSTMTAAFQQSGPSFGWSPSDTMETFLRAVGPQTLTALNQGPPAPYPSFAPYLDTLVKAAQSYTITGTSGVGAPAPVGNSATYDYSGAFSGNSMAGYALTLSGSMTGIPWGLSTNADGVTTAEALPVGLPVTLQLDAGAFDNNIYSAQANAFTVGQSSDATKPDYLPPSLIPYTKNSPYANIAGDLIGGLNFGYLDGNYGTNSAAWFSNPPTPYPFAASRTTNDGFYNPYAAVLYNLSDTYGFPFSDRNGRPSPYISQPAAATTLRVTIMNDLRLDPPDVTIDAVNDSVFTLAWNPVIPPEGFILTGYEVAVTPPYPAWISECGPDDLTMTFGALPAGTKYEFTVTALGTDNLHALRSHPTTVTGITGGPAAPLDGELTFLVTLNWSAATPLPTGAVFSINGAAYTPGGAPAIINGISGTNTFPLTITSATGDLIYQGNYAIDLAADGNGGYNLVPGGSFMLAGNSQPLAIASLPPYTSANGSQLVIGTPFAPSPGKQQSPVIFPA